jgi:hypothetical protein
MRRSPNLRSVGALVFGTLWALSGIAAEGQDTPSGALPTTLAYYQSLDATPWPDYQKLRNGLPWKYTIKFDVGPNRQQIGNLGFPSDPALGRFTVTRKGADLTYSIQNDAGFPIFADFICSYSNGTGDVRPGYVAVAPKTTRAFTWSRPSQDAASATCTASIMEPRKMISRFNWKLAQPSASQPNSLDAIALWISNQIAVEQENQVTMNYWSSQPTVWGTNRDGDHLLGTEETSGSFTIGMTSFSLTGCSAIFVWEANGNQKSKLIYRQDDPDPDAYLHSNTGYQALRAHYEERFNLKDVQPSKIGTYMVGAFQWTDGPSACAPPYSDCKIANVYFEAAADSFTNLDILDKHGRSTRSGCPSQSHRTLLAWSRHFMTLPLHVARKTSMQHCTELQQNIFPKEDRTERSSSLRHRFTNNSEEFKP